MYNTVLEHVCPSHVCPSHVCRGVPLSANSSETAWNFQTPFYRMGTGSLRMVYVIFHKSICHRDFSGRGGLGGVVGGCVVAEHLRDGLEFSNAILQDEYR